MTGAGLQLPILISWIKNISLRFWWLEGDVVSRVTLPITAICCSTITQILESPHPPVTHRAGVSVSGSLLHPLEISFHFLRFLTLSVAVTRGWLVLPLLWTALLVVNTFFICAPVKDKVS